MRKSQIKGIFLILIFLLFLNGCGKSEKAPATLVEFNVFRINASGDIAFYIDWMNTSDDKVIDSLILSISCKPDNESFQYRILETEEIMPNEHNSEKISTIEQYMLPSSDIVSLEIYILQVNFVDGTIWENTKNPDILFADIDGKKGDGIFPVKINEALFFEETANPSITDPIQFQIDWTNISEENSVLGVVYKIIAKSADGVEIPIWDIYDASYIFRYDNEPSKWIPPFSSNEVFLEELPDVIFIRHTDAVIYEIFVWKVIDSEGKVWENLDTGIEVNICGKKGYAFEDDCSNASIQNFIDRVKDESEKHGLNLGTPKVFVKEQSHCVLRYDNIDIRVELSDTNEVLGEKVGFVYYSEVQYEDVDQYVQSFKDTMELLRVCISSAALTELSYTEVIQKVEEFNNNDEEYIDFEDLSYDTFEGFANILDENFNIINCGVFAVGKDLYYPFDKIFWVRESPYEVQRNLEVPHRM